MHMAVEQNLTLLRGPLPPCKKPLSRQMFQTLCRGLLAPSINILPQGMPDPRLLDPVSLFLTDERSDAAVVGSGTKAMGTSPLLTFRSWCRTLGSIITIKSS